MTPKGSSSEDEDDEASFAGLVSLSTAPPPPNDVHNASTTVATLPPSVLELLRSDAAHDAPTAIASFGGPDDPEVEIGDLADLTLGVDEPVTMQLETVILEAGLLTPLPPSTSSTATPQIIEIHRHADGAGALSGVESEIARIPRGWMIAGALLASVMAASVALALLWSLFRSF